MTYRGQIKRDMLPVCLMDAKKTPFQFWTYKILSSSLKTTWSSYSERLTPLISVCWYFKAHEDYLDANVNNLSYLTKSISLFCHQRRKGRILPLLQDLSTNERNTKMAKKNPTAAAKFWRDSLCTDMPGNEIFLKPIVKNNSRKSWLSISRQDTFPRFPAAWHSHLKPLIILKLYQSCGFKLKHESWEPLVLSHYQQH